MNNKKFEFSTSLVCFWIKGSVYVEDSLIKVNSYNTLFGIIPAGQLKENIPLKNVSAASINSQYKALPILIGIMFILTSLPPTDMSFMESLIGLIIGVAIAGAGMRNTLAIQRSGNEMYITVPFFEKQKLTAIQNAIEEGLVNDSNKTNLGLYFDKK